MRAFLSGGDLDLGGDCREGGLHPLSLRLRQRSLLRPQAKRLPHFLQQKSRLLYHSRLPAISRLTMASRASRKVRPERERETKKR